jgi:hypothetical protein
LGAEASSLIGLSGTFFDEIGGKPVIGVDDTLPMDAKGSAYLLDGGPLFFNDIARLGGAINAASGSFEAAGVLETAAASSLVLGVMMGGGAKGFATSAGSSPGKIQRFNFSS